MCSSEMGRRRDVDREVVLGRVWRLATKSEDEDLGIDVRCGIHFFFLRRK